MTNSNPPHVTKPPSAGLLVGASLGMLVVIGGLLYWKLGAKSAEPAVDPAPVVAAAPPKKQIEFDAPPPPPVEEEKPVEPEKEEKKATSAGAGSGGCGVCTGDAPAELQSALKNKAGGARGCYERALRQNSMLQGRVTVRVKVGPGGKPCSANIGENSLGDPGVLSCITRNFMSTTYPAPQGGCVEVNVPLNFMPKQ